MRNTSNHTAIAALVLTATAFASPASAAPQTVDTMRDHRRLVLIAAPRDTDSQAATQTAILSHWKNEADDRDITVITITGMTVTGSADKAQSLRRRFQLKPGTFQVLLIGKDGHVAIRSAHPITAERLQGAIDAMPMRQAGQH